MPRYEAKFNSDKLASAVQARTLELYRQLDLADTVVRNGHKVAAAHFWVKGKPVAQLSLQRIGEGLTPYSFIEIFPQDQHERLLLERLEDYDVVVERNTELESFEELGDGLTAHLRLPDGQQEICQACFLAGCDGARSVVRKTLDTGFPGGIKETTPAKVLAGRFPERVILKAVERMVPRGPLGRQVLGKLRVYGGPEHPHEAQSPQPLDLAAMNDKNKRA